MKNKYHITCVLMLELEGENEEEALKSAETLFIGKLGNAPNVTFFSPVQMEKIESKKQKYSSYRP